MTRAALVLLLALGGLSLVVLPARAAVWLKLGAFTTPMPQPHHYEGQRVSIAVPGGQRAAIYRQRGDVFTAASDAHPMGKRDTIWAQLTEDPANADAGGWSFRLRPRYADGDSGAWSNWVVAAAAVPDTIWCDVSSQRSLRFQWPVANAIKPSVRQVVFRREAGDGNLFAPANPCLSGIGPIARYTLVNAARHPVCCGDSVRCE